MAVIGADQRDLDARVLMADKAGPGRGNAEMRVGALVVHVLDAALGLVVLHPGPGHLAAHPMGVAPAMGVARRRFAEDALKLDLAEAVDVVISRAAGTAWADRHPISRQLRQPRAKPRIDVFLQHLGRGFDMGIGVVYAQPVLHYPPSLLLYGLLYTPLKRGAGTAATGRRKCSTAAHRSRNEPGSMPWAQRGRKHDAAGDLYRHERQGDDARHRRGHQRHAGGGV